MDNKAMRDGCLLSLAIGLFYGLIVLAICGGVYWLLYVHRWG